MVKRQSQLSFFLFNLNEAPVISYHVFAYFKFAPEQIKILLQFLYSVSNGGLHTGKRCSSFDKFVCTEMHLHVITSYFSVKFAPLLQYSYIGN